MTHAAELVSCSRSRRGDEIIPDQELWSPLHHPRLLFYRRLAAVRDAVVADPSKDWSLQSAAAIASLSPKHFGELFKTQIGIGFPEFVHRIRIREACRVLSRNNFSMAEVADLVGYRSLRTFRRNFRRLVGVPPWDFRESWTP